jgi:hypothetical protein
LPAGKGLAARGVGRRGPPDRRELRASLRLHYATSAPKECQGDFSLPTRKEPRQPGGKTSRSPRPALRAIGRAAPSDHGAEGMVGRPWENPEPQASFRRIDGGRASPPLPRPTRDGHFAPLRRGFLWRYLRREAATLCKACRGGVAALFGCDRSSFRRTIPHRIGQEQANDSSGDSHRCRLIIGGRQNLRSSGRHFHHGTITGPGSAPIAFGAAVTAHQIAQSEPGLVPQTFKRPRHR